MCDHANPAIPFGGWHGKTDGASGVGVERGAQGNARRTCGLAHGADARSRTSPGAAGVRRWAIAHADTARTGYIPPDDLQMHRQGLVDAFVDRRAGCTQCALYLRGRLPIGVRQQHPGSFDFARRRRARARKFVEHCLVLPAQHQRRSPRPSCHASLQKESLGWHDRT